MKTKNIIKPLVKTESAPIDHRTQMLAAAEQLLSAKSKGELHKLTTEIDSELKQLDALEQAEMTNLRISFDKKRKTLQEQRSKLGSFLS